MGKLNKIQIENFKSIRKLELRLNDLNVFIGANGVGKSNFIGIFKFLNKVINKQLQLYTGESGGADSILYFGRKTSERLSIKLSFADEVNGYECILVPTAEDRFVFQEETTWFHDKNNYTSPYREPLGTGHAESNLLQSPKAGKGVPKYVADHLLSWKLYHFHDTSDSARVKQTGEISDNKMLHTDAGNLASFLYRLQNQYPQHFKNIEQTVKMVAPFFEAFQLEPSSLNPNKIQLEWKEKGGDKYFNASALSDGTLRFMCLVTLLLQPKLPSIVLMDEPELGLHPYAISLLADLLRSAAKKCQVMVATQSVTLVNQFEPSNICVVDRADKQSVFKHLADEEMKDWLDEYGVGDLWEKNVFGGRP
ncbi:MAG: AAA family ATPase [Bacteroidota bacterium]|nr:AAA family ATPase [Bacteroidota bacterium]